VKTEQQVASDSTRNSLLPCSLEKKSLYSCALRPADKNQSGTNSELVEIKQREQTKASVALLVTQRGKQESSSS